MKAMNRRDLLIKLGALSALAVACSTGKKTNKPGAVALMGDMDSLQWGFKDISPSTRKERTAVPSACWQCVTRDGIVAYVEDGRLVKIEGNPKLPRTNGVLCARGQAGMGQVYDPDRMLYPVKRVGARGAGKWKRISWDDAKTEFVGHLKRMKAEGHPENFCFHYGRMKDSTDAYVKGYFLPAYGTGTIPGHTSICEGSKWTAQELTWGKHYENWDFKNTNLILNFGSNVMETHTNHIPVAQRLVEGIARGAKLYTFDVRLSNTAAKSTEWLPVKPGTDTAVILAMANVIMSEKLYDENFIKKWTNVTVAQLSDHLKKYTPKWAEDESGVPAKKITELAIAFAKAKPGVAISYRGLVAHYAGANNERAVIMLNAICGYINVPGGFCQSVGPKWSDPFKDNFKKTQVAKDVKKLKIGYGYEGAVAYPTHGVCQDVLGVIKEGKHGRPELYMTYCFNPPYVTGNAKENIAILKDEAVIPHFIAYDVAYSEAAALSDMILPAATYLERWDAMGHASGDQIAEFFIRQPVVKPLGEAKPITDFVDEIAPMLGIQMPFKNHEELVRVMCENTKGVKEAGGFDYMLKHGAWYDTNEKPAYNQQEKKLSEKDLEGTKVDAKSGVIFKPDEKNPESNEKNYVGQMIDGVAYKGFPYDVINRETGKLAIYSEPLKKKNWDPLPSYYPIPEHQKMSGDELILTTYKVRSHTQSRSQNCKLLSEDYHSNPAWINPKTAAKLGIKNGDDIEVSSRIGKIKTKAKVTNSVHPSAISISHHCGHWNYGRYASDNKSPIEVGAHDSDSDLKLKWWKDNGEHPNWIIPNSTDPIGGQQRWMDTVVKVRKV
ncbi:MAG: molybdopterin-dependent oxidoreductase [Bdellovibrio sp.]|nr:molybdopterin-dependent oxidoreductase [Bdellovibrio sp.]